MKSIHKEQCKHASLKEVISEKTISWLEKKNVVQKA
jgi:hypothetical protein